MPAATEASLSAGQDGPAPRPPCAARGGGARVYADGAFDLFHAGHLAFLRKAREAGGPGATLIAGVITDEDAAWKRPPVIPHAQRVAMLEGCSLVDEVVASPPLVLTGEFLDRHRITLVVHADDDPQETFFRVPRARNIMTYVSYERDGPMAVSTSGLIARIRSRPDLDRPHPRPDRGADAPAQ